MTREQREDKENMANGKKTDAVKPRRASKIYDGKYLTPSKTTERKKNIKKKQHTGVK